MKRFWSRIFPRHSKAQSIKEVAIGFLNLYLGIIFFRAIAILVGAFIGAHLDRKRNGQDLMEDGQMRLSCHTSKSFRREIEIYAEGESKSGEDWIRYMISASDSKLLRNDIEVE